MSLLIVHWALIVGFMTCACTSYVLLSNSTVEDTGDMTCTYVHRYFLNSKCLLVCVWIINAFPCDANTMNG